LLYFISGVLQQHFSIEQITIKLYIALGQLLQASDLQRKHHFAANKVEQLPH